MESIGPRRGLNGIFGPCEVMGKRRKHLIDQDILPLDVGDVIYLFIFFKKVS